jgi:hypothetical protein
MVEAVAGAAQKGDRGGKQKEKEGFRFGRRRRRR